MPTDIRFSLKTDGIQAKELAKILNDTHLSFREIAKVSSKPEPDIKIYPFKHGSFEYALELAAAGFGAGVAIITTFKSILEYKKSKLDYDKTLFEDRSRGDGIDLNNIRFDPVINAHISDLLKTIGNNSDGFSIKEAGTNKTMIQFKSSEIKVILEVEKRERENDKPETREIVKKKQTLYLIKTSHKPYGMWEFIYDEVRIMAELPKKVKSYYKDLTPGSKLVADLTIIQEFNRYAKAWENKRYKIIQVLFESIPPV